MYLLTVVMMPALAFTITVVAILVICVSVPLVKVVAPVSVVVPVIAKSPVTAKSPVMAASWATARLAPVTLRSTTEISCAFL